MIEWCELKVLYIAPEFPNLNENAAQVRANQLLTRLSKRVELHVFGFGQEGCSHVPAERYALTIGPHRSMGLSALVAGTLSRYPRAFKRYAHPRAIEAFCQLLTEFRPDIVHFDSIGTLGLLDYARKAECEPKIVIHSHDSVSRLYERELGYVNRFVFIDKFLQWKKILRAESELYRKASVCLVDSAEDAVYLRGLNMENRMVVLPLGFDEWSYSPEGTKAKVNHPCLVFSGAMNQAQSEDAALFLVQEVMPLIWKRSPQAQLYLVGARPSDKLLALDGERIHVTGFVEDLASYLRAADVYVCPLRMGSGMRTRIVEALACGCIMVATPEAVQGLSVTAEFPAWSEAVSANDFAKEVLRLIGVDGCDELKRLSVRYVEEKFSWTAVVDELVEIYNEINVGK